MVNHLFKSCLKKTKAIFLVLSVIVLVVSISESQSKPVRRITTHPDYKIKQTTRDSIDQKTGLIIAPGFTVVSTTCVKCHSPNLITGKRASREGWLATIRWMQHSQGLWDLGKEEPIILDYLAKNYAPKNEWRRPMLNITKWYKLNN